MEKTGILLYIGGFELPNKNAAAHRVLNNAKILRDLGKKVVFVGINKDLSQDVPVLSTNRWVQGFESYSVPYPIGKKQWVKYLCDISPYLQIYEVLENVEGIIFYNFQSPAMFKLMRFCRKRRMKCISDVTEWYSAQGKGIVYAVLKGIDTFVRMRILHKKMDGLIVISKYLKNYYKSHAEVVYIPPLTDLQEEKWKSTGEKSKNRLQLVYAGNPGSKDRIDVIIKALQKVNREYSLDIIGMSLEEYLKHNPADKVFLKKNPKIKFHGRLDHIAALKYVKESNYSCFFREENRVTKAGFPTKFVESISSGTPVITNRSSNLEDYFLKGTNGVLISRLDSLVVAKVIELVEFEMAVEREIFDYPRYIYDIKKFFTKIFY